MPITANINEHQRLYLKHYAQFIFTNKLEDFVSVYFMNIHAFKVPLLGFFVHLPEADLLGAVRKSLIKLLEGLQDGQAMDNVENNFWKFNNISVENIPREAVSVSDITLIYSAQRISLQSFLPYYTTDVAVATQVIYEIELHYQEVQKMALQMLELIRREKYEKRLESEEKYRNIFDTASDLIHICSPDGELLYVNNSWSLTLKYQLKELKGQPIYSFVKPGEAQEFKRIREQTIRLKLPSVNIKLNFVKSNGEEVTVEGLINCTYKNNEIQYTTALLHNITEKLRQDKQMQFYIEKLADRERNLRDIIEHAPDGVIVIDLESNIVLWNPKSEEIFGWSREEAVGKKITDLIVPVDFRHAHTAGLHHYELTKESKLINQTVEVPALHKDGHTFYISLTLSNSIQNGKELFIAFLRDITSQRKNALELESQRVQLEKSNYELQQYAWLTSHDLKEPVRKILTFSDALIKRDQSHLSEGSFKYIQKIYNAAVRMKSLIEAVLTYSNIASEHELFVPTNLNAIVEEVIEDLELSITAKDAIIDYSELPVIEAIPIQMTQLFQNIISNSIKYSREAVRPEIHISCELKNEGYFISIQDNGIGFEEVYAEKIFNAFQRLHNKSYEGTGIGLALCKKIAASHKGSIHAVSKVGIGSTFVVYLPQKHLPNSQEV